MITLRTDLTRIQRTNLETCITVHMHQKESTEDLVRKKVRPSADWQQTHWPVCVDMGSASTLGGVCLLNFPALFLCIACADP